jgi:hypothetical protein
MPAQNAASAIKTYALFKPPYDIPTIRSIIPITIAPPKATI